MLIVCPSCATSYDVELASLQPNGRQGRCVRCRKVWRAEPSQAEKLLAAADAIAPEHQDAHDANRSFAEASAPEPAMEHPAGLPDEAKWPDHPAADDSPADMPDAAAAGENNAVSAESGVAVEV